MLGRDSTEDDSCCSCVGRTGIKPNLYEVNGYQKQLLQAAAQKNLGATVKT